MNSFYATNDSLLRSVLLPRSRHFLIHEQMSHNIVKSIFTRLLIHSDLLSDHFHGISFSKFLKIHQTQQIIPKKVIRSRRTCRCRHLHTSLLVLCNNKKNVPGLDIHIHTHTHTHIKRKMLDDLYNNDKKKVSYHWCFSVVVFSRNVSLLHVQLWKQSRIVFAYYSIVKHLNPREDQIEIELK